MYSCISHYVHTYINICVYIQTHIQLSLEQCGVRALTLQLKNLCKIYGQPSLSLVSAY